MLYLERARSEKQAWAIRTAPDAAPKLPESKRRERLFALALDPNHPVTNTRFPASFYATALMLTAGVLVALVWNSYHSFQISKKTKEHDFLIHELRTDIIYLDEVLTMSAQMAVATGDQNWEHRYRTFEPKLKEVIRQINRLSPHVKQNILLDVHGRTKLGRMEQLALDLVREGRSHEARAVLLGDEYEVEKRIYVEGLNVITQTQSVDLVVQQLHGTIVHLDEVLTMSAHLAAATGELRWEQRYRSFEPRLEAALQQAMSLAPYSQDAAAQTDEANRKLVEMENLVFALARQGHSQEALAILTSQEYRNQKRIYAEGMEIFTSMLKEKARDSLLKERNKAYLSIATVLFILPILLLAWLAVLRSSRKWQTAIVQSNYRLTQQTERLAKVNEDLAVEIHDRKRAEHETKELNNLLNVISHAQSRFITDTGIKTIFNDLLNSLLSITQSEYGFIGEVLHTPKGEPYLKTHAITNIAWDDPTRKFYEENAPKGMEFYNLKTLFGTVMTTGRPVISQDPPADPRRGGLPKGHPPLRKFLGLPFHHGEQLVGMVGIANRPDGYNEELINYLEPFLATCGNLVEAYRNTQRRKEVEEKLRESEETFRTMVEHAPEGILVFDHGSYRFVDANPNVVRLLGYTKDQLLNMSWLDISKPVQPGDVPALEAGVRMEKEVLAGGIPVFEWTFLKSSGEEIIMEVRLIRLPKSGSNLIRASILDITERKRAEKALTAQAIRDSLTGLYNRHYFDQRIREELARADRNSHSLAILLCDLDRFKAINDSRGHQTGDEVIKAVSSAIQNSTRGTDFVFRWGGDEFIILLSDVTREGLLIAAERIRKAVRTVSQETQMELDVSIGVSLYPEHGRDLSELIRLADRALYIAKKGGGKVHIGEEEYSLDEDSVKIVFQPVVDVLSGEVLGHEALSRDPQGKLPILELFKRYRAIGQLTELKCICFRSQIRAAQEIGLRRVYINADFEVLKELDSVHKPPGMEVILEISEMEALQDIENHLRIAKKWRALGYKFAIDDFGAGFVSLPFIAQLMPEHIKVDRSTLVQAALSEEFHGFLRDLLAALKNYSKEGIIAEGMETEKELQMVKDMGIFIAQGFLLGMPGEIRKTPPS